MSKDACSYHETRPAIWECDECARRYCGQCVTVTDADPPGPPRCALCGKRLEYLGSGNAAQPFWSVAHRFFALPLTGSGLAFLALEAVLALLVPFGLLGLFVLLLAVAAGVKYGFAVLEAAAMGDARPPPLGSAIAGDEEHLFLKFAALLIALGVLQGLAKALIHPAAGTLVGVLVTLIMPAVIILLAVNKKIGDALAPARIAALITGIGWPYLLAVFLTNVISTGPYVVAIFFAGSLAGSVLALPLLAALTAYFAVVNFAMLGYLIYEHQASLGFVAGDPERERVAGTAENRRRQLLGDVNVLVKESRAADALNRLRQQGDEFAEDMTFQQRHFDLAVQTHAEVGALARAADPYLELLMTRDGADRALDVWRRAIRVDPAYRPANPAIRHTLAEHAHAGNLDKEALALLVNLHKQAPQYEQLADAYALAARLLRDQGQDDKADKLEAFTQAFLTRRAGPQPTSPNLTLLSLE